MDKNNKLLELMEEHNVSNNLEALIEYLKDDYTLEELEELIIDYCSDDTCFGDYYVFSYEDKVRYCIELANDLLDETFNDISKSSFNHLTDFISWSDYKSYLIEDYVCNFENLIGCEYLTSINDYEIYK